MDYISRIYNTYGGNISLQAPYQGKKAENIPDELYSILSVSNGILQTMFHPETGEKIEITWILYPFDLMSEQTAFFKAEYNIEGVVFADDGAGSPFIMKPDGKIICYNVIVVEETIVANTLFDFYKIL